MFYALQSLLHSYKSHRLVKVLISALEPRIEQKLQNTRLEQAGHPPCLDNLLTIISLTQLLVIDLVLTDENNVEFNEIYFFLIFNLLKLFIFIPWEVFCYVSLFQICSQKESVLLIVQHHVQIIQMHSVFFFFR